MANQKISELTALTNANLAATDLFAVVDTSAVTTKSILVSELDKRYDNKLTVTSVSTTYTILSTDELVIGNTSSAAFTATLPAASSVANQTFTIKKIASATDFNGLTIDGDGSETIDGSTSIKLFGAGEAVRLVSDGSNWQVLDWTPSKTMTYTPTLPGATNLNINTARVRFSRKEMDINGQATFNGSGGAASQFIVTLPSGPVIDTANIPGGTGTGNDTATVLSVEAKFFNTASWDEIYGHYLTTTTVGFRISTGQLQLAAISSGEAVNYVLRMPVT